MGIPLTFVSGFFFARDMRSPPPLSLARRSGEPKTTSHGESFPLTSGGSPAHVPRERGAMRGGIGGRVRRAPVLRDRKRFAYSIAAATGKMFDMDR